MTCFVAATWSETMLTYYPLAFKPGWYFLDRKIKNRVYVWNGRTKKPRQLINYLRGEVRNKTNWNTYVVIKTERCDQCIFDRIRKLFSRDVIPLCLLEICTFEITATSPRGQLLATRNPSRSHFQSLPESMLTQFYVATRPQRVKLESKLKKTQKIKHVRLK